MNELLNAYQQIADNLGGELGASDTLIHVHAGMLILLVARVITGRSLGTIIPFSVVLLASLANEIFDYLYQGQILMPDALYDVINTVFWPFVLMVGIRVRGRNRLVKKSRMHLSGTGYCCCSTVNPRFGEALPRPSCGVTAGRRGRQC
ncbi:MAG TPA: hypothetical protein VGR19_07495 [Allosphingosinicella sp.]|nr:hypothetical protein [Allosphingosinicella sp.]